MPSHLNDRHVSLQTRKDVGFFSAARGLSLTQHDMKTDQDALVSIAKRYKETAQDIVNATSHRLYVSSNEVCWQLISEDRERIYLGHFHVLSALNLPYRRVRLRGLDAQAIYGDRFSRQTFAGSSLTHRGMDMPYVHSLQLSETESHMPKGDFSSWPCEIERIL